MLRYNLARYLLNNNITDLSKLIRKCLKYRGLSEFSIDFEFPKTASDGISVAVCRFAFGRDDAAGAEDFHVVESQEYLPLVLQQLSGVVDHVLEGYSTTEESRQTRNVNVVW